jgi:hypothetical protein
MKPALEEITTMNLVTAIQDARRASREKFIKDNGLVLHHIVGNANERIEQWDFPKKANGGRYDHYLMIQVHYDESWGVALKLDVMAEETEYATDMAATVKRAIAFMDGKVKLAK